MVEALRSPFAGHQEGKFPNAAYELGVSLTASVVPGTALVSTWISGIDGLTVALKNVWGNVPEHTGKTCNTSHGLVMRTGPEEFLLVPDSGANIVQTLRATVTADMGSVTDLSHARCRIHIEGTKSQATLNKLFALDLRETEFPVGEVRLTGTHHVPCVLHRLETHKFAMVVFSTYAFDQLGTLMDAALEFGVSVSVR